MSVNRVWSTFNSLYLGQDLADILQIFMEKPSFSITQIMYPLVNAYYWWDWKKIQKPTEKNDFERFNDL